jgi:hypothetical protein
MCWHVIKKDLYKPTEAEAQGNERFQLITKKILETRFVDFVTS